MKKYKKISTYKYKIMAVTAALILLVTPITVNAQTAGISTTDIIYAEGFEELEWKNGELLFGFSVPNTGKYNIELTYQLLDELGNTTDFEIAVDNGDFKNVQLKPYWKDDGEKRVDSYGNEMAPSQKVVNEYTTELLIDRSTIENLPFEFELSQGTHTLVFKNLNRSFVLAKVGLVSSEDVVTYEEATKIYNKENYSAADAEQITIEGENAVLKSEKALVSKSDNSSAEISPSNATKQVINYIGGSSWANPGETITWEFTAEKSGLYNFGLTYKQDQNTNGFSYRDLKIDGKTPFAECKGLRFDYDINWQTDTLGGEEPYLFYLEEGKHTISFTASLGELSSSYQKLKATVTELGDLYLAIAMITGETPDPNRDYDLFKQIPDFNAKLEKMKIELTETATEIEAMSTGATSLVTAIKNMVRILNSMIENPYTAQNFVSDYYSNYTTLSSWLYDMKSMPLAIDRIYVYPADTDLQSKDVSWIEKIGFSVKRFFASFVSEYSTQGKADGETIKIWVNWGRDQTMVLSNLISQDFTPKTDINVNLEITSASIIYGMLSGNAPDLALHLTRSVPVNLAMRGALVDLSQFDDYEEIITRFGESATVPYEYNGGVYALPDQQSFYIMFYRKDVLDSLGIKVPETWDEFLTAAAVLQRNNMQAWIPYNQINTATEVNTGVGGLNLFASVLQQFGGNFYNDKNDVCLLDSATSMQAFTYWTDMYTKHNLPTTASFYNRFRTGTMPLGIEGYTQYTTILSAAPEIEGRWGISLVPGIRQEDGTVDHTVAGSGTGCSILHTSKNVDAAWEFLKWWTSADVQLSYNNDVEAIIGAVSRTTTANIEAFSKMAWEEKDLEILLEQRKWIKEIPEIPGSYYVGRSVDQAFWNVINDGERPKDMLVKWAEVANNEINRKIEEYKTDSEVK